MNGSSDDERGTGPRENDPANTYPFQSVARPRILAVGEAASYVALLNEALADLYPHVEAVPHGDDALVALAAARYDAIVLLPPLARAEGADLCRLLRAHDAQVPLVVLDAGGSVAHVVAGLDAGADAYLIEPLMLNELRARLAALLRRNGIVAPPSGPSLPAAAALSGGARPNKRSTLGTVGAQLPRVLAVGALVAAGALADRAAQTSGSSAAAATTASLSAGPLAALPAAPAPASTSARTGAATLDAATEAAFAKASPAVVYIENLGLGSGSGVLYDTTGDIVTNAHVVAGQSALRVTLATGKTYPARLVGSDAADDLAVVKIAATGLPAATFAPAGSYRIAQTVLAIGSPLGLQQSVTAGLISALDRTVQEGTGAYLPNAIQTSAPINPGNSGGALVNLAGVVVGIPTLEATDAQNNNGGAAQGIGFAVPSVRVSFVAAQLIKTGTVAHTGRAYLGVGATDNTSGAAAANGFNGGGATPVLAGALVQQVASGSPAAGAGVQQGDVITAVDGNAIGGQDGLLAALAKERPGTTITLSLERNGATSTVRVVLSELPAS